MIYTQQLSCNVHLMVYLNVALMLLLIYLVGFLSNIFVVQIICKQRDKMHCFFSIKLDNASTFLRRTRETIC